ncbi:TPA: hypothetical protein ACRRXZ_003763, partial [Morganella morganii]
REQGGYFSLALSISSAIRYDFLAISVALAFIPKGLHWSFESNPCIAFAANMSRSDSHLTEPSDA